MDRLHAIGAHVLVSRNCNRRGQPTAPATAPASSEPDDEHWPLVLREEGEGLDATASVIFGSAFIQTNEDAGDAYRSSQDTANLTVRRAIELGVREFDTAPAYGDSERALGIALLRATAAGVDPPVQVHTKIAGNEADRFPEPDWSAEAAEITYTASKKLLGKIATIRAHGLRHDDRPSPNSPRLRDWCAPLDQALLPGLGPQGGLLAGLRDLRERGDIACVSLGMDAPADVRGLGIVDLIREAPEGTFDSALVAYGCTFRRLSHLVCTNRWHVIELALPLLPLMLPLPLVLLLLLLLLLREPPQPERSPSVQRVPGQSTSTLHHH